MAATRTRARGGKHRNPSPGSSWSAGDKRGWFRRHWLLLVAIPVVFVGFLVVVFAYMYAKTPVPVAPALAQTTRVYDRHGHLLTTLHAEVNRTEITFAQMPLSLRDAAVAIEDKNFYHEGGVSFSGIARAAWENITHHEITQGGSTITQQYVKQVYTGAQRTISRKITEAIIAMKIDKRYTKDQILERYLNTVYFGQGAYGAQAAAETYWGIPASRLSVLQSATLAGLIQSPSTYDPVLNPGAAKARRNQVLQDMAEQGYISSSDAISLQSQPVRVNVRPVLSPSASPYFTQYVSEILQRRFGYQETFTGGLKVTTSLDLGMQRDAEEAVRAHLPSPSQPAAALVAIDPRTGQIRAMVGGRNFRRSKVNYATSAMRQAGSAFKPFTLVAALEDGIGLNSVWYGPSRITIPDPECYTYGGPWQPSNFADEAEGTMNLVQATAHSVNTIFAQLVAKVGPEAVANVAHRMGITTPLQNVCSITLGSQAVTPLDMADAYATFAANGVHHPAQPIASVTSSSGQSLFKAPTRGQQVVDANNAELATYAMEHVVTEGTGTAAAIGRPVAGKTGTAENFVDAWFCGYTPQLAACVWMGYPKNETTSMYNIDGFGEIVGGSVPALIWHDFMVKATAGMPVQNFRTPSFSGYNNNPGGSVPSPKPTHSPTPSPTPTPSPSPSPSPTPTGSPSPSPTVSEALFRRIQAVY